MSSSRFISIRGAREHNLDNINIDIPRDQLVVITGLSGSGKSSLAFDTMYAEGQRRYVESMSAYVRQFLQLMQKPDTDSIEGLSPAISIEQKTTSRNPRSTVGTITEIYDYLRLLFARAGTPYSPATGLPIESQSITQMVDRIMALKEGTRLFLLAPFIRGRKGEYKRELSEMQKKGFLRVKIDGSFYEIDETPPLDKNRKHDIDIVVDRIIICDDIAVRLADSIATCLGLSDGILCSEDIDTQEQVIYSANFSCPVSGFTIEEIEPRLFSFNSPYGACPSCNGLGHEIIFVEEKVIADPALSLRDGTISPWSQNQSNPAPYYRQTLEALARHFKFSMETPFQELSRKCQEIILFGTKEKVTFIYQDGLRSYRTPRPFEGVIPSLQRRLKETDSDYIREELSKYQHQSPCQKCQGYRLKEQALAVKIGELHIGEVCQKSIRDSLHWFKHIEEKLSPIQAEIAQRILKEIRERLTFLFNVGLTYLTLSRASGTLSGGESQRIRLASQIGSGLTGVLYVLDEPSIGLHQRDNGRLLETLKRLRNLGNSVIVVEHDEEAIRTADHLVDIGPGAGIHGGKILFEGKPKNIEKCDNSLTGDYLSGKKFIAPPEKRREGHSGQKLVLRGAIHNNLKNVTVEIPLGVLTCVTGVSGSGKSSLVIETLQRALSRQLMRSNDIPGPYESLDGLAYLDKIIVIDQSPIGRTPRSNPATYTGAFTPIRDWFCHLPESRARGYQAGRFSFNVKGGRCENCKGDGILKIEMHFLPDVYVQCDHCKGQRYNRETLQVKFRDRSIADILGMTVDEGVDFFKAAPSIYDKLKTLQDVGLGYIGIGQQATTLSGGEAQRIKLARELSKRASGRTAYILDEPTTGLHFHNIAELLDVLHRLIDQGNSIIVVEHNLDIIKMADWVIDMGPEGGDAGGYIVKVGTPEDIAACTESHTGRYLKVALEQSRAYQRKAELRTKMKKQA